MMPEIGTKLYYSIGEVAELTRLPPYTLRSWEKEFPCLRPKRVRGKNRAFRARDIAIILLIKRLLHEERYSTPGARQKLRNEPELIRAAVGELLGSKPEKQPAPEPSRAPASPSTSDPSTEAAPSRPMLREIRDELREVLRLLG